MDVSSDDDIRTLVESARDEALIERRRRNLVVNRETSFSIYWTGTWRACAWTVASRGRPPFSPAEVSLQHEAAQPVSSRSAPPSARVLNVDGFSRVIDELVCDMLGRAVSLRMMRSWVTWVCTLGTGHEFRLQYEDHPVTRRDERDITAVELGSLHHELPVVPLRWFADFAM